MTYAYNDPLHHVIGNALNDGCKYNGVISGLAVSEKTVPSMTVTVALGSCAIAGTKYTESGASDITLDTADPSNPRKDLLVYLASATNPSKVTGTPAATPIPPDILAGSVLLAVVDVPANDTTITNDQIHDGRVFVGGIPVVDTIHESTAAAGVTVDGVNLKDGAVKSADLDDIGKLILNDPIELTISGGVVTATQSYHQIDTEADAGSDDLDTINGGTIGQILVIRSMSHLKTVVVKDGTGNLRLAGDFTIDNPRDSLLLFAYSDTYWMELSRSANE